MSPKMLAILFLIEILLTMPQSTAEAALEPPGLTCEEYEVIGLCIDGQRTIQTVTSCFFSYSGEKTQTIWEEAVPCDTGYCEEVFQICKVRKTFSRCRHGVRVRTTTTSCVYYDSNTDETCTGASRKVIRQCLVCPGTQPDWDKVDTTGACSGLPIPR
jgi:hypothetical protein